MCLFDMFDVGLCLLALLFVASVCCSCCFSLRVVVSWCVMAVCRCVCGCCLFVVVVVSCLSFNDVVVCC